LDAYNAGVALTHHPPATSDTTPDIDARLIEAWRQMTSVEIAAHLNAAWRAGQQLTWFSVKERYPDASDDELRIRVAVERLGWDLAIRIHPEAARLEPRG
jgi:hypothetical protein